MGVFYLEDGAEYERHELSGYWKDMEADDFAELVMDVSLHGIHQPIVIYGGQVLDGWHRYLAGRQATTLLGSSSARTTIVGTPRR